MKLSNNKAEILTYTGSTISTGSGMWIWLGNNHDQIAALGVIVGMIVGITGVVIQLVKLYLHCRKMSK